MNKRKPVSASRSTPQSAGGLPLPCLVVTAPPEDRNLLRLLDAAIAAETRTGQAIERMSAAFLEARDAARAAFIPAAPGAVA